nr:tyrosine-type recombinase/integrase [Planctomycetota bacterium]
YIASCAATTWAPRTVASNRPRLYRVVRWLRSRGIRRWANLTAADLDAFLLDLVEEGLAYGTRNNYAVMLRSFGDWLTTRGRVLSNPAADLAVLEEDEGTLPPAPLSEEQVRRLFEILSSGDADAVGYRTRLHAELLYGCALRSAEAVNLAVTDLDFAERIVLVRGGKGDKDRMVPMMRGVLSAAKDYLAVRRELLRGPDTGILLIGRNGQRLNQKVIGRVLDRVSRILGVHVYPHLLRHSLPVHLLRNGVDVRVIQEILGHAQLDTTQIYLRLVPGHLREDYDKAMPPIAVEGG